MKSGYFELIDDAVIARFWAKVDKTDTCWLWTAAKAQGYGRFAIREGYVIGAPRFAFEITYGRIPDDIFMCHHCDVRACVRPDHLFAGTQADNIRDMVAKGRQARGTWWNRQRQFGEDNPCAKLTTADVIAVRQRCAAGESQAQLARELGVNPGTISAIVTRRNWPHLVDGVVTRESGR